MALINESLAFQKLQLHNSQRVVPISPRSVESVVSFLIEANDLSCEEMIVHFVGKRKIAALHAEFFDDPTPTDCITFPIDSPEDPSCKVLGELFICPQVAKEFAEEHGIPVYEELTLYLVHGFLHLLGYDDLTPDERKKMRAQEKRWMGALAKNGLGIHE